jgi:polysaccharide chain length determinant protein (PEP-CTERM system associated)
MNDLRTEILTRLAIVWRRRWLTLIVVWVLCVVGWGAVFMLPNQYRSQALVYIDTDTLLGPLLKNLTVENDVEHQVPLIQRTLLSRPNLHKVAVATDMALDVSSPVDEVNLYERMERHALISAQSTNLFAISYTDANPTLARNVVQALISVLVDNSNVQNQGEMDKALGFIEKQISTYEEQLRGIEQRMAEFKRQHVDLMISGDANMGARKDSAHEAVSTTQGQIAELESRRDLLNQQMKTVPQFLNVDNAPQVIVNGSYADPQAARIAELQRVLDALRLQFTDKHPDVIAARRQLEEAQAQAKAPPKPGTETARYRSQLSNPVFEQMQMRLFDAEQQLALAQSHLVVAQASQAQVDIQAAANPSMVAQYTDLTREYDVLKKQYDELLVRRESARMSQAVENTSQKIQFRVVEPPTVPAKPFGPNRLLFLIAVLAGSMIVGPGLAFLLDRVEVPVTSASVLARHSALPVLGNISLVRKQDVVDRAKRWKLGFAGAAVSLLLIFGGLFLLTLNSSGILTNFRISDTERTSHRVG